MAILKFTQKDKMASAIIPAGYFSFKVVELAEPRKSSSGKSFNIFARFVVIEDEKYEGKELTITFNTGMNNPSIMGTMHLMPHTYIQQLAAATAECDILEVPDDLDTDSLKDLKFDGKVERVINDGVVLNTISAFLPYGSGKAKESEGSPF